MRQNILQKNTGIICLGQNISQHDRLKSSNVMIYLKKKHGTMVSHRDAKRLAELPQEVQYEIRGTFFLR